jgi:hypothetical protein
VIVLAAEESAMLPSLLLAALAPAAPVPPGAGSSVPGGVAPIPMYLKADAGGQVVVSGTVTQVVTLNRTIMVNVNGNNVARQEPVQVMQSMSVRTALADVKGTFATVGGVELTAADAAARVRNGAVLFVSADGKPVEKGWLRGLGEDTVVVTTDALKNLRLLTGGANQATTPAPRMVLLAAGDDGKVRVEVNPNAGNGFDPYSTRILANGAADQATAQKPLDEVTFDAYDLSGTRVSRGDALKRLKNGGMVLMAGDHRLPDEAYLKAFGTADLLVLASSELVLPPPLGGVKAGAVQQFAPAVKVLAAPAIAVQPVPPAVVAKPLVLKPAIKVEVVKPEKP